MTRFLLIKTGLGILYNKCEIFRQMTAKKSPERSDLIESFEHSVNECRDAMIFLEDMDREYRVMRERLSDLELVCTKLSSENAQLRLTAQRLIDKIDL